MSDVEDQLPLKSPSPEVDDALSNCLWGSKKKISLDYSSDGLNHIEDIQSNSIIMY